MFFLLELLFTFVMEKYFIKFAVVIQNLSKLKIKFKVMKKLIFINFNGCFHRNVTTQTIDFESKVIDYGVIGTTLMEIESINLQIMEINP